MRCRFRGEAIRLDNLVEEMKTELDLKKEQKEEIGSFRLRAIRGVYVECAHF